MTVPATRCLSGFWPAWSHKDLQVHWETVHVSTQQHWPSAGWIANRSFWLQNLFSNLGTKRKPFFFVLYHNCWPSFCFSMHGVSHHWDASRLGCCLFRHVILVLSICFALPIFCRNSTTGSWMKCHFFTVVLMLVYSPWYCYFSHWNGICTCFQVTESCLLINLLKSIIWRFGPTIRMFKYCPESTAVWEPLWGKNSLGFCKLKLERLDLNTNLQTLNTWRMGHWFFSKCSACTGNSGPN